MVLGMALAFSACGDDNAEPSSQRGSEAAPSERRAPLPAPERTEVVGAYWDGKIAVLGGLLEDDTPSNQLDLYAPATDRWSTGPQLPLPLHHAGAGVLGGRLYVVGGYTGTAGAWTPVAAVHSLGPGESQWRAEPPLGGTRGALAVASLDNALVAVGGVGSGEATTEILQAGATAWRTGPAMGTPREHLAATAAGGRVYAIAGRLHTLESNRDSSESFAPGEPRWRQEPKLNDSRGGIGGAAPGGRPCVAGGEAPGGRTIESVECLKDDVWVRVATLEVPRHGVAVVAVDNRLHVIGGGPKPGLFVSDVHEVFDL